MSRKISREALESARARAEANEMALRDFVRALSPEVGWRFVAGPRDGRASLIFYEDEHVVIYHVADLVTEERRRLERALYDTTGEQFMPSLFKALEDWRAWIARVYPHMPVDTSARSA